MSDSLEKFWALARRASFHFADDSTKEWGMGSRRESEALAMLDRHPEWWQEVRENWGELWSLPKKYRDQP